MKKCLALNKNFIPIRIISKYDAICKLFMGNAVAITFENNSYIEMNFDDWQKYNNWPKDQIFINSATMKIAVPRTIRYIYYSKIPKHTLSISRKTIFDRDDRTCYICGKKYDDKHLTIDHIVPTSRGGKREWKNLITCCQECNWRKGNRLLSEIGVKPKFIAYKPNISNIQKLISNYNRDFEEWSYFGL